MFADTELWTTIWNPMILAIITLILMMLLYAWGYGPKLWKEHKESTQKVEAERKEHEQKVEGLLTEIRDAMRQKP
jgi:hypothetical protein